MIIEFTPPGAGNTGNEMDELDKLATHHNASNIVDFNEFTKKKQEDDFLSWCSERGLTFPSDQAKAYEAIRKPRGDYPVSMREDLISE